MAEVYCQILHGDCDQLLLLRLMMMMMMMMMGKWQMLRDDQSTEYSAFWHQENG